jgi:hypothetical protein
MSLYPENPAGQTFISQDTYASAGISLSGLGGGGGTVGPVINGVHLINADPTQDFLIDQVSSFAIKLENNNGDNDITLERDGRVRFNYNNEYGVIIDSTGRTIEIYPGNSNPEGALEGISTINGVSVGAFTGSIPANLTVSTLTAQALLSISSINGTAVSAFTGDVPANLAVSSLTVNGANFGNITLNTYPDAPFESARILFNSTGQESEDVGQLQIQKDSMLSLGPVSTVSGLAVNSFSTVFGQVQPLGAKSIILGGDNNDNTTPGAEIAYTNTTSTLSMYAPNVSVPALVNVSSINATPFFAPRSGIFFLPPGVTTSYYNIPNPPAGITTNAVVMCTLTRPDGVSQNWIVNSGVVQGATPANWYIEVVMGAAVADDNTAVAWDLVAPNVSSLGTAGVSPT